MSREGNTLASLSYPKGAVRKRKRVGRGTGSNWGKTCGLGHKGQKSRSGGKVSPQFEGGQMPIHMRTPKRGFNNRFRKEFIVLNVSQLSVFAAGSLVNETALQERGLIPNNIRDGIKILGNGELAVKLSVAAHRFSQGAIQKIEAAGGSVEVVESVK